MKVSVYEVKIDEIQLKRSKMRKEKRKIKHDDITHKINLRIECVECLEDMKETSRYDNTETSKLIFFECPKCKKKISITIGIGE